MEDRKNTKENILQRLYNHAAGLWGVQSVEDLDPFIKLMMQGVASMLYDVNNEIEDINVRMLESLATVLTPSILIDPRPAHAVAQAYPSEPVAYIDRKTVFFDKRMPPELQSKGIKSLSFVPLERVRLVSGKIKYMVTERLFHRVGENGDKMTLAQAHTLNEKTNHTVWIGIDLHPEVETFRGLSFYIDFPLAADKYDKYRILPYSRWSIDGEPLDMKAGLPYLPEEDGEKDGDDDSILKTYNLLSRIDENISGLYRMQYLTVLGDLRPDGIQKKAFPDEIIDLFPESAAASTESCYWITVVFPAYITVQDIHAVKICINTFPVANKTFYSHVHPSGEITVGIIPMRTQEGEHFISVEKVSGSHGTEYRDLPYSVGEKSAPGFYSVKRGGAERFDRRNAGEYLERMIDLLRDESVAFSSLNADNMQNIIFEIQKGLNRINVKYEQSAMAGLTIPSYLLLNTGKDETIFAEYWATHCELANGLRAGKLLTPQSSVFLVKDSCRLLTETRGGKSEASASGRQDAFRYVLAARDGIITQEDAANFCRMELGAKVTRISVSRGVGVSAKPKEGLIRTIDVHLTPSPGCEHIVEEMQADLLVMLHRKSPDSFNYRIIIELKR